MPNNKKLNDYFSEKSFFPQQNTTWASNLYLCESYTYIINNDKIIRCIKGEDGKVLAKETEIRKRWRSYFSKLFNGENEYSPQVERGVQEGHLNVRACSSKEEVKEALRKMKFRKAVGLNLIPVEIWKCLGEVGLDWLT